MSGLDCTRIAQRLYMGSHPRTAAAIRGYHLPFHIHVMCAYEHQKPLIASSNTILAPLSDENPITPATWTAALQAANAAAKAVHAGKRVLITCAMGWNRSGLVTGAALWYMTGWAGPAIVTRIKTLRYNALNNRSFSEILSRIQPRRS